MKPTLLVVLLLLMTSAHAAVVFSQPPSAAGGLIISSWVYPNGSDADMYVYDNFQLSTNQAITEIDWRGGYLYNATLPDGRKDPATNFTLTIYESIAGGSQPHVTNPQLPETYLAKYQVGGNAGETVAGAIGGQTLYDYKFVLPTPFQAMAGVKYWLRIEAYQSIYPDWGIAVGTGGDRQHFQFSTGAAQFQTTANDAAFVLQAVGGTTFTITTSTSPTGNGNVTGGGAYAGGTDITLVATPSAGFAVDQWLMDGTVVQTGGMSYHLLNVQANHTIQVTFKTGPIGDLNTDGLVNEDDADLVLQYVLGERADLDATMKTLATQAGLPANPPDIRVALWIMGHVTRSTKGGPVAPAAQTTTTKAK